MSFTGAFSVILLSIVAIALLGPSKLPAGIEQLWLMLTNFRLSQSDLPPLTLEQARRSWQVSQNPLYDLVQILYGSVEHLIELRHRLFVILGVLVGGGIASSFFAERVLIVLKAPAAAAGVELIRLRPTDYFLTYFEVVVSMAVVITFPVLLVEVLMFVRPALETKAELAAFRAITVLGMPAVLFFFALGLSFGYFVMLPAMMPFVVGFGSAVARESFELRAYFSFVLTVLLWIGVAFETPLIMTVLARLGIVSPDAMARQWRYALVGIAIMAAAITPTVDPFNMMVVMIPLLALYFIGILMSKAVYRRRPAGVRTA